MSAMTGGCLCGAVRYEATGEPLTALRCHCRDCQYLSGGEPLAEVVVPASALAVTRGKPAVFRTAANSGAGVRRSFCPACGTPLFAGIEAHPDAVAVTIGSLDDPARHPPTVHVWTASAQPWHRIDPARPAFERNPPFE